MTLQIERTGTGTVRGSIKKGGGTKTGTENKKESSSKHTEKVTEGGRGGAVSTYQQNSGGARGSTEYEWQKKTPR